MCLRPKKQPGEQRRRACGGAEEGLLALMGQGKVTSSERPSQMALSEVSSHGVCVSPSRRVSPSETHFCRIYYPSSPLDRKIHRARTALNHPAPVNWPQLLRSRPLSWHLLSACSVRGPGLRNLHALTSQHSQGSLSGWWYYYYSHFAVQ